MVDTIEKLFEVDIHHPSPPFSHKLLGREHRLTRAPLWPEAVAVSREGGVEDRG